MKIDSNDKPKLRTALRKWFEGCEYTVEAEFENAGALIWVVNVCWEGTNHLPEYHMTRAFFAGGKVAVSADAANCTPEEVLRCLPRVIQP